MNEKPDGSLAIGKLLCALALFSLPPCLPASSEDRTDAEIQAIADDFKISDACLEKLLVPPFHPPCIKEETDAALLKVCLRQWHGDAEMCRDIMDRRQ